MFLFVPVYQHVVDVQTFSDNIYGQNDIFFFFVPVGCRLLVRSVPEIFPHVSVRVKLDDDTLKLSDFCIRWCVFEIQLIEFPRLSSVLKALRMWML